MSSELSGAAVASPSTTILGSLRTHAAVGFSLAPSLHLRSQSRCTQKPRAERCQPALLSSISSPPAPKALLFDDTAGVRSQYRSLLLLQVSRFSATIFLVACLTSVLHDRPYDPEIATRTASSLKNSCTVSSPTRFRLRPARDFNVREFDKSGASQALPLEQTPCKCTCFTPSWINFRHNPTHIFLCMMGALSQRHSSPICTNLASGVISLT